MKKKLSFLLGVLVAVQMSAVPFASAAEQVINKTDANTPIETQKLIDSRPDIQRPMENLGRGVVAVNTGSSTLVSWRWLGTESADTKYNVYRDGQKLTAEPISATSYVDITGTKDSKYQVTSVVDGVESELSKEGKTLESNYFDIPINKPADNTVQGEAYSYSAGDASVGDLDGDGEYEIVLKWDPSNAKDAAQAGYTGECIIDAYKQDGTQLWRITMGPNIRSGAHDTQFLVYDFDGDGKAEVAMRTADGTIDGKGTVIGDAKANWSTLSNGKNLTGPLYLSVFKGETGEVIDTVNYDPQSNEPNIGVFGDNWGNRSERYLADVAYLDGKTPSMVFCRGYYFGKTEFGTGRTVIATYNLVDGKLVKQWRFDTLDAENSKYIGQGNHSMSAGDVDFDGCDELIYGSLAIDNDGKALYSTGMGHGDAQHLADLIPDRPGLEIYSVHEDASVPYGQEMRDARTGEILFGSDEDGDIGRGAADDVDPTHYGAECWAAGKFIGSDGEVIAENPTIAQNFFAWWDGDLGRELQDGINISKWNPEKNKGEVIFSAKGCTSINGTKSVPSLTADLFGDWREETIYPLKDNSALRVFTTDVATNYKIPTLMHDPQYRLHVAVQNVCYNQPTHTSYYLGFDTKTVPVPQMYVKDSSGNEIKNPDLAKKNWSIDKLYSGKKIMLALDEPKALNDNSFVRIDNDNEKVAPFLAEGDRTLVPLRFIAEAFGADVAWDDATQGITITLGDKVIKMTADKADYTVDGTAKTLDVPATIKEDRTFVPLRAIAENLDKKVYWYDGLIVISDIETSMTDAEAAAMLKNLQDAPTPAKVEQAAISAEKMFENQLPIFGVSASDNDGNVEGGAVDGDMDTRWSAHGPNWLIVDLGSDQTFSSVAIAMWKGDERTYPFSIEVSSDGDTWTTALEKTENSGLTTDPEVYTFKAPVTARYVRYSGDGDTVEGKNYCHISEIAVLK